MGNKGLLLSIAFVLVLFLTSCGVDGGPTDATTDNAPVETTSAEPAAEEQLIIRVADRSDADVPIIACGYTADEVSLGSKICERTNDTSKVVNQCTFLESELPSETVGSFKVDVYVAANANDELTSCDSAVIHDATLGEAYVFEVKGDFTEGFELVLTDAATGKAVDIIAPEA